MKISAILLAAGNSTRFGENKLLAEVDGEKMYMNSVKCVEGIEFYEKIIVTQFNEIKEKLKDTDFKIVINNNSELGLSHSISLGINASGEVDAYLFLVCDQPYLKRQTIEKIIKAFKDGDKGIACVRSNGRTGNPCIFSKAYKNKLLELTGDVGGKQIINNNSDEVLFVEIKDEKELVDIDEKI